MSATINVICPKCHARFDTSLLSPKALCQICGTLSNLGDMPVQAMMTDTQRTMYDKVIAEADHDEE